MYYRKKIRSIGILGTMVMGVGVFYYSLPFAGGIQEVFTGIPVYAAEEVQESFIPLDLTLEGMQKEKIQLDYLCKLDDSYMIIGKMSELPIDIGYYLKGTTNQKEKIEFHLSYADENLVFFISHDKPTDFTSVELQLYEQKYEEKTVLSTEEIDDYILEDAAYDEIKEFPVDKAFTVELE